MGVVRAAVYARLSRQKADAEMGLNIGDQQAIGKQLVERRGWTLVPGPTADTFTDDGMGAFKDDAKRPAWEAMLAAKPDVIVVRDAARLGRNFPDYTALLLTKAKVVVWLDDETGDVNWDVQAVSIDTEAFMSAQVGNRVYSQKIQKGVKRKNRLKAAAGGWPHGGTRPFGYHHPPQCCKPRGEDCQPGAIIEAEAKVIRDVAERWLGGGEAVASVRRPRRQGHRHAGREAVAVRATASDARRPSQRRAADASWRRDQGLVGAHHRLGHSQGPCSGRRGVIRPEGRAEQRLPAQRLRLVRGVRPAHVRPQAVRREAG